MNFTLNNYSMSTERRYEQDWYEWCVFVDGERSLVEQITNIEYTLPPTSPDPICTVTDKEHRFALLFSGWGEFEIRAEIATPAGEKHLCKYRLDRSKAWPIGPPASDIKDRRALTVYNILVESEIRWRKVPTIASRTSLPEEDVGSILLNLQGGGFVRKAPQPSLDGQELWAATSLVGRMPSLEVQSVGALATLPSFILDRIARSPSIPAGQIIKDDDLRKIRDLDLSGLVVTGLDQHLVHLVKLPAPLPALEKLDLRRTNVTDAGMEYLGRLTSLQELHLRENHLGDQYISDPGVAQLTNLTNLQTLDLRDTHVANDGLLKSLTQLKSLKKLQLTKSWVNDNGLQEFRKQSNVNPEW